MLLSRSAVADHGVVGKVGHKCRTRLFNNNNTTINPCATPVPCLLPSACALCSPDGADQVQVCAITPPGVAGPHSGNNPPGPVSRENQDTSTHTRDNSRIHGRHPATPRQTH